MSRISFELDDSRSKVNDDSPIPIILMSEGEEIDSTEEKLEVKQEEKAESR